MSKPYEVQFESVKGSNVWTELVVYAAGERVVVARQPEYTRRDLACIRDRTNSALGSPSKYYTVLIFDYPSDSVLLVNGVQMGKVKRGRHKDQLYAMGYKFIHIGKLLGRDVNDNLPSRELWMTYHEPPMYRGEL